MLLIGSTKYTVDGVDVYPDHASPFQYWYIPGRVRLAERDRRKVLSYLWYTDSAADAEGTGFLNFEVNTAVPPATLEKIRREIAGRTGISASKINLATVPYKSGAVNFSVLGPLATQAAGASETNPSVLYQSAEQVVWSAGTSSLVGDNAAVCSVKFTKEGRLAAAMKEAILSRSNMIAALYRLEFLSMRPSVTFRATGSFEKVVSDFQISIGGQIPLQALLLDVGVNGHLQRIMQDAGINIEVINFTGEEEEGQKWAMQFLIDYFIANFFQVQLDNSSDWKPVSEAPQVAEAIETTRAIEDAAAEQAESEGLQGEEADSAGKELVKTATFLIPKVSIRAAIYHGQQVNTIDFYYSEMKARPTVVLPQSLVLEGLDNPASHVTQVNRSQDPFGRPYNVTVALPPAADLTDAGLQAINVHARYPADAPPNKQTTCTITLNDGKVSGANPLPFQYDARGSADVAYTVDYVFKPGGDWSAETHQYSVSGRQDRGLIPAMPEAVVEFLRLDVLLDSDFVWEDANQVVVTLTSRRWTGEKRVVFLSGKDTAQTLKIRNDAAFRNEPIQYKVELRKGTRLLHARGPETALDKRQIVIYDRFAGHVPVAFKAGFAEESADVVLFYQDGDFQWEDAFTLENRQTVTRIVPTLKPLRASQLKFSYEVTPLDGETYSVPSASGGRTVSVKSAL